MIAGFQQKPIEQHIRRGEDLLGSSLLLRGSPLTLDQIEHDVARTARAFTFAGTPCRGISAELAMDGDDVDYLLREGRVRTRAVIARIRVSDALASGFLVLPTFSAPHHTIVAERAAGASLQRLLELALRDVVQNPYHRPWKEER